MRKAKKAKKGAARRSPARKTPKRASATKKAFAASQAARAREEQASLAQSLALARQSRALAELRRISEGEASSSKSSSSGRKRAGRKSTTSSAKKGSHMAAKKKSSAKKSSKARKSSVKKHTVAKKSSGGKSKLAKYQASVRKREQKMKEEAKASASRARKSGEAVGHKEGLTEGSRSGYNRALAELRGERSMSKKAAAAATSYEIGTNAYALAGGAVSCLLEDAVGDFLVGEKGLFPKVNDPAEQVAIKRTIPQVVLGGALIAASALTDMPHFARASAGIAGVLGHEVVRILKNDPAKFALSAGETSEF